MSTTARNIRRPQTAAMSRWRLALAATSIIAGSVAGAAPLAASASTTGVVAEASASRGERPYARQAKQATNRVRTDKGAAKVRQDACLRPFAARQARRMARRQAMEHQNLGPVLRACGMNLVGENLASGYGTGRAAVVDGWMKSPAHRDNLLDPRHRRTAIVAVRGSDGAWYVCQLLGRRN